MRTYHERPSGSPPANHYSHAVEFDGRLITVSGQVALSENGQLVGEGDASAQVRQVFANLEAALAAANAQLADIVQLTVYLTDIADLAAYREVRDQLFQPGARPASTLVQVVGLVDPRFKVEISALAAL